MKTEQSPGTAVPGLRMLRKCYNLEKTAISVDLTKTK